MRMQGSCWPRSRRTHDNLLGLNRLHLPTLVSRELARWQWARQSRRRAAQPALHPCNLDLKGQIRRDSKGPKGGLSPLAPTRTPFDVFVLTGGPGGHRAAA